MIKVGAVGYLNANGTASIEMGSSSSLVYIHTHPSGSVGDSHWKPAPSAADINAATSTSYVISLRDKNVYIYNQTGILSIMKLDVYQNYGQVVK